MFWSDHGEQFWEHGGFEHGAGLYAEETLSTVAFWAKNLSPATWSGHTSHPDIVPTIMDAIGVSIPSGADVTGQVIGTSHEARVGYAYHGRGEDSAVSAELGTSRLFYFWDGHLEFYVDDPMEVADLYSPTDETVQALWECLKPQAEGMESYMPTSSTPVWPSDL